MKKSPRSPANRKAVIAATLLSLPLIASAQDTKSAKAEPSPSPKKVVSEEKAVPKAAPLKHADSAKVIKIDSDYKAAGVDSQGRKLYKNSRGEVFYLDPKTGDYKQTGAVVKSRSNVKTN